jgi:hypothetical protein
MHRRGDHRFEVDDDFFARLEADADGIEQRELISDAGRRFFVMVTSGVATPMCPSTALCPSAVLETALTANTTNSGLTSASGLLFMVTSGS